MLQWMTGGAAGVALVASAAFAQPAASDLTGSYSLMLSAGVVFNSRVERYDLDRDVRISEVGATQGASDLGSLAIRADGTYELRYWYYATVNNAPVVRGRWARTAQGEPEFEKGAIKLIDAAPNADRPAADRVWYVFRENGKVYGRYAPFAETVILTPTGSAAAPPSRPTVASEGRAAQAAPALAAAPAPPAAPAAQPRTYTPDQVRRELTGKTVAEISAILGQPAKAAYGTYSWNGVERAFPRCSNGCNWRSFAIQFDGAGKASSIELQSWVVE